MLIENLPGSVRGEPDGARVLRNARPLPFAANVNQGIAATSGEFVLVANPDAVPAPDAVVGVVAFMESHPRAGIAGPADPLARRAVAAVAPALSDGRRNVGAPNAAPFALRGTYSQRGHYQLDERPTEPVQADWLLGAFLLMRRAMLDELGGWDGGFRHYGEDIDLSYRAFRAGWERWYVPAARVTHDYAAVIDRRFLTRHTWWHLRGMARFVRKHPERLLRLG